MEPLEKLEIIVKYDIRRKKAERERCVDIASNLFILGWIMKSMRFQGYGLRLT